MAYRTGFELTVRLDQRQIRALKDRVRLIEVELDRGLADLAEIYARLIRDEAQRLVPKDTYNLHDSITGIARRIVTRWVVEVKSNSNGLADYDSYVEYGTSDSEAQPFLRPAFEKYRPLWVRDVTALKNRLRRMK